MSLKRHCIIFPSLAWEALFCSNADSYVQCWVRSVEAEVANMPVTPISLTKLHRIVHIGVSACWLHCTESIL